jgi:hypothetical protein
MSDNVVSLFGERPPELGEPNEALVRCLEGMLDMAKSGRLQSMIATGFTCEGNRMVMWADHHPDVYQMLGALAWLQHEYVHRHTEALP